MKILVLCSGSDRIFLEKGYQYSKNLIELMNKPLIERVLTSLRDIMLSENEVIVALRREECARYHTSTVAKLIVPECVVIEVPAETEGATCTALLATGNIKNEEPLMIINGDIIVETDFQKVVKYFVDKDADGGAITFDSVHPRWSYVKCDDNGFVIEATEKRPISRTATVGVYYYKHGRDFIESAKTSIKKNARIDGKFYICPVFNEMILNQKVILTYQIDRKKYHSLSTPAGVDEYIKYLSEVKV